MVRFRILGPLEIRTGQGWAGIGAPKWRSLLATLLINAGQVVPTDRLIMELWGDDPPARATNLVSIYALRLRRLIGDENGHLLRTRAPGYQLSLEPGDVDASRFDELVRAGRQALAEQAPDRAADLLAEALGLWRGGALVDVPASPLVAAEASRLEDARLDAAELRIAADVGCGRYVQVTPELTRLVADHPLREGLWGLLMQALDGAGRHAEALAAYARAREMIAEELGVDPGEQLQALYQWILTEDARQPRTPAGPADRESAPSQPPEPVPPERVPPMQLPADIADFTGRELDVKRLCELQPADAAEVSPGAVMVGLVTGAGGLGKTTLAVHVAHRLRSRFPDGQLYVNLLGASPQPLHATDVLARFLRDLGVDGARIPTDETERAALLRTRLTGRRVIMLLDNARDAAQVRPLLPGSSGCVVLVTARNMLPDLTVARRVLTWYLHTADAAARIISPNHARVPVGRLGPAMRPLAFTSLEEALDWAEAERASLVALTRQAAASGEQDFAWRLPAAAMSFFYRRGHWADWITTHEIGLQSAREIGDRPAEAWMLNNLGMAYGLQRMEQAIGSFELALAIYRDVGDRQGEARAATNMLTACFHLGRFRAALDAGRRSLVIQREVGNRYGEGIALGDLGCASRELGLHEDAISWHEQALAIFRELGDKDAEADSLSELADVYLGQDRVAEALDRLAESLDIRRDIGDRHGQATTLRLLGLARTRGGQPDQARALLAEAARIFAELGDLDQAAEIRKSQTSLPETAR